MVCSLSPTAISLKASGVDSVLALDHVEILRADYVGMLQPSDRSFVFLEIDPQALLPVHDHDHSHTLGLL